MKIIEKEKYELAVEVLRNDGVVGYPTDTVFGLCVLFNSKQAKQNLINKKNRPKEKSFPIMVSDVKMLCDIAKVTDDDLKIINKFMPGPLTVVLKKKDNIEDWINDGKDTFAIRIASDETLKKIIEKLNTPIFLTSANKSDFPVCKNEEEILSYELADLVVRGTCGYNVASTIVDLSNNEIVILRQGPISKEDILKVIQ